jgi:hypothetical protein
MSVGMASSPTSPILGRDFTQKQINGETRQIHEKKKRQFRNGNCRVGERKIIF